MDTEMIRARLAGCQKLLIGLGEEFWMQILRQKDMRLLFPRSIMQICMSW